LAPSKMFSHVSGLLRFASRLNLGCGSVDF
jgi:hypothetical protein